MIERGPFKSELDHYKFLSEIHYASLKYRLNIIVGYN